MHAETFREKYIDVSTYSEMHQTKIKQFDEYKEGWMHEWLCGE